MKILILGCSFMAILNYSNPDDCDFTLANNIVVKATPGSGKNSSFTSMLQGYITGGSTIRV